MNKKIKVGSHLITDESPAYIIAEMSGNHNMDFERAKNIIGYCAEGRCGCNKNPDIYTRYHNHRL